MHQAGVVSLAGGNWYACMHAYVPTQMGHLVPAISLALISIVSECGDGSSSAVALLVAMADSRALWLMDWMVLQYSTWHDATNGWTLFLALHGRRHCWSARTVQQLQCLSMIPSAILGQPPWGLKLETCPNQANPT